MAENHVIGVNNTIPWSIKEDMIHFKELTMGWPCIMGRKTWESLPTHPLPGRLNIVVSKGDSHLFSGAEVFPSLHEAIHHCENYKKVFICGGAAVYREALVLANKIELTLIHRNFDGDTFFPNIDPALWEQTFITEGDTFSFITYIKKLN